MKITKESSFRGAVVVVVVVVLLLLLLDLAAEEVLVTLLLPTITPAETSVTTGELVVELL